MSTTDILKKDGTTLASSFPAVDKPSSAVFPHHEVTFYQDEDYGEDSGLNISIDEFAKVLTRDIPFSTKINITRMNDSDYQIDFSGENYEFKDTNFWDSELELFLAEDIKVYNNGQGLGRILMHNYIQVSQAMGLKALSIDASAKNGAYVWARVGIPLKQTGVQKNIVLNDSLSKRLNVVAPFIPQSTLEQARQLIECNSKYDISAISDLGDDVCPYTEEISLSAQEVFPYEFSKSDLPNIMYDCADTQQPLTLGQFLLHDNMYYGLLEFDDSQAMERISTYAQKSLLRQEAQQSTQNRQVYSVS